MSLAIKKILPKFYRFTKNISCKIPMHVSLWDNKSYNLNYRIYKMINQWKSGELKEEADIVYQYYKGGDLIDVGALSGFYSFLLSPKANNDDHFISCEPDHNIHSELFNNLSILKNNFNKINFSVFSTPVNNGKEVVIAHDDWGHPCFLEFEQLKNTDISFAKKFKSTSIDKIVANFSLNPSFIKIDTEGAELDILKGMEETLKNFRPMIMLEKHPTMIPKTVSLDMIDSLLKKNNYKVEKLINKSNLTIREIWKK
tara:strand:+ start:86 stop:853 length:768 start_codon:yes stop_codon:yes gene_type:complete